MPICPRYPDGPVSKKKHPNYVNTSETRTCLETGEGESDIEQKVECQQTKALCGRACHLSENSFEIPTGTNAYLVTTTLGKPTKRKRPSKVLHYAMLIHATRHHVWNTLLRSQQVPTHIRSQLLLGYRLRGRVPARCSITRCTYMRSDNSSGDDRSDIRESVKVG